MFCPNCGKPCNDTDAFCGSCGHKLPQAPTPAPAAVNQSKSVFDLPHKDVAAEQYIDDCAGLIEGAILTNSKTLASKLHTSQDVILRLLAAYVVASKKRGICYQIIDAADYVMQNPAYSKQHIKLSTSDSWKSYTALLADYYAFARYSKTESTCYLFIIGGEDIIPMPRMRHYMADHPKFSDKDIDTDIPYAYLLEDDTYKLLESGKLFEYEQYFHVGRLPFAVDASLDDLTLYFRRVAESGSTFEIDSYYGQTNMPWGDESQVVCAPLRRAGVRASSKKFENTYVEREGQRFNTVEGELFYSIPIDEGNVSQVFDPNASFYYFNLHGSDQPTSTGFYADYAGCAISPKHIATIRRDNFFVTEACYGARFQQYKRHESILLSAMGGKTLLFLGSSRAAFCNNRFSIDNSDLLATVFIEKLLAGATAGEALFTARSSFFECDDGHIYDQQMTTIAEFNLFGDPTLSVQNAQKSPSNISSRAVVSKCAVQRVCESKCLYDRDKFANSNSILEQVRQAVDSNLMKIRKVIDEELYARMNVSPRSLSHIFLNRFGDGREFYSFDYVENREGREDLKCAIVDKSGKIITVISTK